VRHSRHRQQLLVDKLQRIDALFEFDVLIRQLGLIFNLAQLLLDHLLGALRKRREASAIRRSKDKTESVHRPWSRTGAHMGGLRGRRGRRQCSPEVFTECLHSIHDGVWSRMTMTVENNPRREEGATRCIPLLGLHRPTATPRFPIRHPLMALYCRNNNEKLYCANRLKNTRRMNAPNSIVSRKIMNVANSLPNSIVV